MTRKTIAHYLTDLRTDLKDSGTLWSDAELTRCVERAVADLSRMVPRERSKEITVDAGVTGESVTTPTAEDTDYFVTTWDISAKADGDVATLAASRPDVPRPVQITITDADASITQLVIIVKGYDDDGKYIEEFFYLEGGLNQTGQRYFALVTEVELDEITGEGAGDELIVGTGDEDGVFVKLANKPIKLGTVAISGQTLDTDFEADYSNGRIALKSGGSMSAGTAYTVAYTKSRIEIDLAALIDDLIRVDRVEYPSGNVPQQFSNLVVWGNVLTLTGSHVTQAEVSDAEHLVIKYYAPHSPPEAQAPGSYPSFLDTTVQQAASAYALFVKALEWEHQSVTDFASARTAMGNLSGAHSLAIAAIAKIVTYLTANSNDDAKAILEDITDDVAGLRTAILAAQDAANALADTVDFSDVETYLTKAVTDLENANTDATSAGSALVAVDLSAAITALDAANAALDNIVSTSIGDAANLLDTGEGFIDRVNDGERVPENYSEHARAHVQLTGARVQIALGYAQEAAQRISGMLVYVNEANGYSRAAEAFVAGAAQYVAAAVQSIARERAKVEQATVYLGEAESRLANLRTYIEQAAGWGQVARGFAEEAGLHMGDMDRYLQEANLYQQSATGNQLLAERFREEAIERRNEAWAIWRSPHQISPTYALGQRGQPL